MLRQPLEVRLLLGELLPELEQLLLLALLDGPVLEGLLAALEGVSVGVVSKSCDREGSTVV